MGALPPQTVMVVRALEVRADTEPPVQRARRLRRALQAALHRTAMLLPSSRCRGWIGARTVRIRMRDSIAPRLRRPATCTAVVLAVGALTAIMALAATAPRASAAPALAPVSARAAAAAPPTVTVDARAGLGTIPDTAY